MHIFIFYSYACTTLKQYLNWFLNRKIITKNWFLTGRGCSGFGFKLCGSAESVPHWFNSSIASIYHGCFADVSDSNIAIACQAAVTVAAAAAATIILKFLPLFRNRCRWWRWWCLTAGYGSSQCNRHEAEAFRLQIMHCHCHICCH